MVGTRGAVWDAQLRIAERRLSGGWDPTGPGFEAGVWERQVTAAEPLVRGWSSETYGPWAEQLRAAESRRVRRDHPRPGPDGDGFVSGTVATGWGRLDDLIERWCDVFFLGTPSQESWYSGLGSTPEAAAALRRYDGLLLLERPAIHSPLRVLETSPGIAGADDADLARTLVDEGQRLGLEWSWDDPVMRYFVAPTVALAVTLKGCQLYLEHPALMGDLLNLATIGSAGVGVWRLLRHLLDRSDPP